MLKKLLIIVLIVLIYNCKEEKIEVKTGTIKIKENYIKYKPDYFSKNYFLIKSLDDNITYSSRNLIDIGNRLPYGNYKLIYSSYYNIENETEFKIDKEKTTINYYIDSLDYTKVYSPLIDELGENEILNLIEKVNGCVSFYGRKMNITKKGIDYFFNGKKLNIEQFRLLREFEFEIRNLDLEDYGCTYTHKFLFLNNSTNDFVSANDQSCWYYGFSYLMERLNE